MWTVVAEEMYHGAIFPRAIQSKTIHAKLPKQTYLNEYWNGMKYKKALIKKSPVMQ